MPTSLTSGIKRKPYRSASRDTTWEKVMPSTWGGLPITSRAAPAWAAAFTFSGKPPLLPASLVTSTEALQARSMARFISVEKGPCMA